jgi:polyisoprenoid-binding protein YceI
MRRKLFSSAALALATLTIAAGPAPVEWNIDKPHTGISFSVNHFFTPVRGQFDDYNIDLLFDRENPENSTVRVRIAVASVNTGNDERNAHLQSEDFFEAETYPYITFVSESVREVAENQLIVRGPLKIKGQVMDVELPITILGIQDIPAGDMREMLGGVEQIASFRTDLEIDRGDFGVGTGSWAATMVVGSNVDIGIAVEANR